MCTRDIAEYNEDVNFLARLVAGQKYAYKPVKWTVCKSRWSNVCKRAFQKQVTFKCFFLWRVFGY
jgi:hypothetical protein